MSTQERGSKSEEDLSERLRHWLKHIRAAERSGEALSAYAERLGLSKSSLYESKSRLRSSGVLAPRPQRRVSSPEFARVVVADAARVPASLRVRLASGALLEWSEAPQGDALRELIGLVS